MVDSVICENLLHVATLDSIGEECPRDRVRMFSEREVTMNEKHPYALGPRFDIHAARILLKDEEGSEVLVKIPRFSTVNSSSAVAAIIRICEMNQGIHLGVMKCHERPALVTRLFKHGNVADYIRKCLYTNSEEAKLAVLRLVIDVAADLKVHHGCQIVHGSLTTRNVLINDEDQAIVCDYGSKEIYPTEYEGIPGDWPNEAPEVVAGNAHSKASDAYRFATATLEMFRGKALRMPLCARFLRRHMYGEYKYERPINMDQDIFDIIIRATALDGASRPSVEQMEHDLRLVWNSKKR